MPSKYRSRVHMILLYPDNPSHLEVLDKIKKGYDFAGIIHNRDTWTEEDEKENPSHKAGDLKKEHIHIVLRCQNAVWNTALCKDLGLEEKFLEQVKNLDRSLQYLLHYNEPDKIQYSVEDVFGGLRTKLLDSLTRIEKSESEQIIELLDYIDNFHGQLFLCDFSRYCASNGYWSVFRRSGSIFLKLISEHNGS